MVLTVSLCDALLIYELQMRRVVLDYAVDLSVPRLDRGRNAGVRLLDNKQCTCVDLIIIIKIYYKIYIVI